MKKKLVISAILPYFIIILSIILSSCAGSSGGDKPGAGATAIETAATDTTAPMVSSTAPANNAVNVAPNAAISVTFSEPVQSNTVLVTLTGVTGTVSCNGVTVTFSPTNTLAYNTTYTATVKAQVKDQAGNAMTQDYVWSFTTGVAPDTIAPTVSSTSPANNATNVAVNGAINVTFSEAMDATTINTTNIMLNGVSATVTMNGMTATITPASNLSYGTTYSGIVKKAAKDLAGNEMATDYTWSFTTGAAPDTIAPTVSSTSPANNATNVAVNGAINVTFSEAMDATTINTTNIMLNGVSATVTMNGMTATITPASNLSYGTTYSGTVKKAAKDLAGNEMATDYTWSFTTGAAPDTIAPTVSSTSPANGATNVATNAAANITFSEAMDATTINTTNIMLNGVSATVTMNGMTATITPASNLSYGTTYSGIVKKAAKDLAGNEMATDYTWSFTTGAAPDTTSPTVISTTPANNAVNVATNATINAAFSEAMDASTISTATFTVEGVAGTVTYVSGIATFTSATALAYNTTYTATVKAGVKDLAGNTLGTDYSWSFTTGNDPNLWKLPSHAMARSSVVDGSGNLYVAGVTSGAFPGFTNAGSYDVFIAKFNSNGTLAWVQQKGTVSEDGAGHWSLAYNSSEIFLFWGEIGQNRAYVSSFNESGNENVTFLTPANSTAITCDLSGVYIATAIGELKKVNKINGAVIWTWVSHFGSPTGFSNVKALDGNIFIVGAGGSGLANLVFAKISTSGTEVWTRQWGTTGQEAGYSLATTQNALYISGKKGWFGDGTEHYIFLGYDLDGNYLWENDATMFGGIPRNMVANDNFVWTVGVSSLVRLSSIGSVLNSVAGNMRSIALYENVLYVTDDSNVISRYKADTLDKL